MNTGAERWSPPPNTVSFSYDYASMSQCLCLCGALLLGQLSSYSPDEGLLCCEMFDGALCPRDKNVGPPDPCATAGISQQAVVDEENKPHLFL
ncbi:hypothetical protein SKAU_G00142230 [Synaphobranchus kaupii]|uniref:Uncharacterized protein n=1 Tax=Synaphobranchus kaupii TaxID=118154 RepID=A0A9Q1FSI6_SYNKA|nr:hypothetical protein SKAU_G00142230 [Synaphobranchus kaupii]